MRDEQPTRSLHYIELFRLCAACAVVFTHINMWAFHYAPKPAWWSVFISAATKFSVPTFMVVAAFLHTKSYEKNPTIPKLSTVMINKWHALFLPFFAWNLIYLSTKNNRIELPALSLENIWSFFTGYNHLYFISILFQFFLIFHWYYKSKFTSLRTLCIVCASTSLAFYSVSEFLLWTKGPDNNFFEWYIGNAIVGWSVFFCWGVVLAKQPLIVKKIAQHTILLALLTAVAYIFYVGEIFIEYEITKKFSRLFFLLPGLFYQFLAGNLLLSLCMRISTRFSTSPMLARLVSLGKYTFTTYLAHNFFIPLFLKGFSSAAITNPILIFGGIFVLTMAACIALEYCLRSVAPFFGNILFGKRFTVHAAQEARIQRVA